MLGVLDNIQIEEVLTTQVFGRIGCYANGVIYVVPVSYAYDGEYIYGHTHEGMKVSMMRENAGVCFEVEEMKDMANWKTVITWGSYEELTSQNERNDALHILINRILPLISSETTHLSKHWPFPVSDVSTIKGIVFRIKLYKKTGRYETNLATSVSGF